MFRRLRVLAAFFMVPVVIVFSPQSATAATVGPWVPVDISVPAAPYVTGDGNVPGSLDTIDCYFSLQQGAFGINVGSNGRCIGLPDVTWGYTQPGEAGSGYTITVSGLAAEGGGSCSGTESGILGPHSLNGTVRVAGSIPSGIIPVTDCAIQEVCIDLGPTDQCVSASVPVLEDEEEPPPGEGCVHGFPTTARLEVRSTQPDGFGIVVDSMWLITSRSGAPLSTASWGAGIRGVGAEEVRDITAQSEVKIRESQRVSTAPRMTVGAQAGIEIWAYPDPHPTQKWNQPPPNYYQSTFIPTSPPSSSGSNFHGTTDPTHCRFYFGPKVVSFTDTDIDEPYHDSATVDPPPPVEEPPPVEPPAPEVPVLDEPDNDLGWLAKIWALLQTIWGSIQGFFQTIWDWIAGLGDFVKGLFVPADGYMDARFQSVQTDWEDTSPSKYWSAFSDLRAPSSNGCSGMPLDVTLAPGVRINESIGAACGGTMADVAALVRLGLSAVIIVGGAFACVRGIGSGLGWDPGLGRGRADA